MKQHIDMEQLDELSQKKFKKLEDILGCCNNISDYEYNTNSLINQYREYISKKLTIAKMIEIIHQYDPDIEIEGRKNKWYVGAGLIHKGDDELVNALWKLLKAIL